MATVTDEVIVRLQAQVDEYKRRISDAENHSTHAFSRINVGVGKLRATLSGLGPALGAGILGAASIGGAVALGRAFLDIADKAKQLHATLQLATEGFGNFGQAQADVRRIAMETRAPLEETARLYSTFLRSANELGISQKEAARATETISKSFLISGASAVEAAQGTRQLIQAIQSGTLRGDEFNTMMESAPRLAKLFADSMGVPVKSLRSLAEQGKITADQLINALVNPQYTKGLDEQFKKLPVTFDQAMTQVENAAQITFSAFDRGGEFSNMLVAFVMSGAESFQELEDRAEVMGGELRSTISALYNVFDPMGDNAISVMGIIEDAIRNLRMLIAGTLQDLQNLANAVPTTANFIRTLGRGGAFSPLGLGPGGFGPDSAKYTFADQFMQGTKRGDFEAARRRVFSNYAGLAEDFPIENGPRGTNIKVPPKAKRSRKRSGGDPEAKAERQEEQFQTELERLNMQLLQAREAQATASEDVYRYQLQEVEAERANAKAAIDRQASGKNKRYTEAQAAELKALEDRIADAKVAKINADREQALADQRLEVGKAELQNEMDVTRAQAKFLRTREMQKEAALTLLDLQYEQQRLELEAIIASKQSTDAQKQIAEARLKILDTLKHNDVKGVDEQYASPARKYFDELQTSAMNLNDELENLAVDKVKQLATGFGQAAAAGLGLKGVIGDLVAQLAEMALQYAVILPLMRAVFGGSTGGIGGIGGIFSLFGGGLPGTAQFNATVAANPPGLAKGGPVRGGSTYLVGEEGPELFTPSQSGTIIPNGSMNGRNTIQVEVFTNTGYLTAQIRSISGPMIANASVRAAQGGSALARHNLARDALHRLG